LPGLLLLSLLWSLSSLQIDLFPHSDSSLPPRERETLPFILLCVVATLFAMQRRLKWPRGTQLLSAVWIGVGLFLVPSLLVQLSSHWIPDLTRAALFALVPIFVVVFEPYIGAAAPPQPRAPLQGALVALGGMLCIFPLVLPHSIASELAFCAVILAAACAAAANCFAVRVVTERGHESVAPLAAIAGITTAAGFAATSAFTERLVWHLDEANSALLFSTGLGLVELLLLFWLMRRLSAVRMSTRYLLAPLIAAVFGLLYFQIPLTARTSLGFLLLGMGSLWLLLAPHQVAEIISVAPRSNRS